MKNRKKNFSMRFSERPFKNTKKQLFLMIENSLWNIEDFVHDDPYLWAIDYDLFNWSPKGSYRCGCESGYTPDKENICIDSGFWKFLFERYPYFPGQKTWNDILKILIKDINECKIRNDDCDLNAVCENKEGSFSCECRGPLFYGSGKAWDRIHESHL